MHVQPFFKCLGTHGRPVLSLLQLPHHLVLLISFRVGADFEYPSAPESQRAYCMLVIRTLREFGDVLQATGNTTLSARYRMVCGRIIRA